MFIIRLFPSLAALLGWIVFKIFSILMSANIEKQQTKLLNKINSGNAAKDAIHTSWNQITQFVTEPLISKIQFAGTILGFVLGILFVLMVLVYGYINNMM
jgi:hypothetical protein